MPCPNKVNIPKNFEVMNYYRVWGLEAYARRLYGRMRKNRSWKSADACAECGECEPKCPQHIPIRKQLEEVASTLG